MNKKVFSSDQIAQYYHVSEDHYRFFWKLQKAHALHYGYWDDTTKSFVQALNKINDVMATSVSIQPGEKVVDAGCGIGGSVVWLATHRQAKVTGITLSDKQCAQGNKRIQRLGIGYLAELKVDDFTSMNIEDQSVDVVWAIESICHAADKQLFLKEAYRVLKPGGRLVMADFFIIQTPSPKGAKQLDAWAHGWAVPFFETKDNFDAFAHQVGFVHLDWNNITENIRPSAKRLYRAFFLGWMVSWFYNIFHPKVTEASKKNVLTAYYQYTTLKAGWWNYFIFSAQKPF
ncbi:MAG: methyltransferase domain-containing protein [Cytophagaceae bacterium]|jgi:cyclopropane fatty-acyl-phospholipid synthase-like methyltransferase|nr:methyltransferase domain-containing protein [Cytophagaceae bacterium]